MSFDGSDGRHMSSFTWIIEHFLLCPLKFKEPLFSPKFTVECLGSTVWRIILFPRGSKDAEHIACYLQRVKDSSKLEYVNINFRFVILHPKILNDIRDNTCNNVAFEEYQYWGFTTLMRRELAEIVLKTSSNQKLILRCDLSPCDPDISTTLINENLSLQKLSSDIVSLYQTGQFHDLVLRCDGKEFKVHQAIVIARAPKLAKEWKLNFVLGHIIHRDIDNFTGDILNYLLYYLYSGSIIIPESTLTRELWLMAETYELADLKKKLVSYPKHYTGRTSMNIEHKSLVWRIITSSNKPLNLIKVIPLERSYMNDIIIRCSFGSSPFGLQRMDISMNFSNFEVSQPISVSCKISLVDEDNFLLDQYNGHNFFATNNQWNVVLFSRKEDKDSKNYFVKKVLVLCCDLTFCYGEGTAFTESSWIYSDRISPHFNDCSLLSWDLGRLRANLLFSDVSLVAENVPFPAHRSILAVRSPVFQKMFQHNMAESKTGTIHIYDIHAHTIRPLLIYIYSGRIDMSYSHITQLYTAADKYEILTLRDNCASILLARLTVENSCHTLLTGYLHNDKKLLIGAEKFIHMNSCKVKKTLGWNFLTRKYSTLAENILNLKSSIDPFRRSEHF